MRFLNGGTEPVRACPLPGVKSISVWRFNNNYNTFSPWWGNGSNIEIIEGYTSFGSKE